MKREFVTNRLNMKNDHTEPLEQKMTRWLARAKDAGGWFQFMRLYTKIMSKLEAQLLQDLMNRAEMVRRKTARLRKQHPNRTAFPMGEDGYFSCSVKFMLHPKFMTWSEDEQKRHFKSLREKGFISTANRTTRYGWARWVKINYVKVEEGLDEAERVLRDETEAYRNGVTKKSRKKP